MCITPIRPSLLDGDQEEWSHVIYIYIHLRKQVANPTIRTGEWMPQQPIDDLQVEMGWVSSQPITQRPNPKPMASHIVFCPMPRSLASRALWTETATSSRMFHGWCAQWPVWSHVWRIQTSAWWWVRMWPPPFTESQVEVDSPTTAYLCQCRESRARRCWVAAMQLELRCLVTTWSSFSAMGKISKCLFLLATVHGMG